jgi:hypothetical protein
VLPISITKGSPMNGARGHALRCLFLVLSIACLAASAGCGSQTTQTEPLPKQQIEQFRKTTVEYMKGMKNAARAGAHPQGAPRP